MTVELTSSAEERSRKFFALGSFSDLAALLEISPGHLNFVLHYLPAKRYNVFEIPKKKQGENRLIANPVPAMKNVQKRLLQVLECVYEPRASTYGFVKGKDIVKNAKAHRTKRKLKYVLNIDLKDFFPSIHFGRVRGLFQNPPYNLPPRVATTLAKICCYENGLPQGAPTSPIISNMICSKLDSQLQRLAQKHRCIYTRYADDITFSTSMPRFPTAIAQISTGVTVLGEELAAILEENNFQVNPNKIRLQEKTQRQEITGVVVNRFPNVPRSYIRQVRAMLHDWKLNGYTQAERRHVKKFRNKNRFYGKPDISFKDIVRGKIEYIGMVRGKNDPIYRRFMLSLSSLDPSVHFEAQSEMSQNSALIFLSYTRADVVPVQELYDKLLLAGYKPWMDTKNLIGGENWQLAINKAIKNADIFVAVLSPNSVGKRGVIQLELRKALEKFQEKLDSDIFIIPLIIGDCKIPDQLQKFQWIDYRKKDGWARLTQAIQESIKRASGQQD
jgi:RNA-directed DNA polymerase